MISVTDAIYIIKKMKGEDCEKICEYDSAHYMLLSRPTNEFYLIDKYDGSFRPMNPLEDFAKFRTALNQRVLFDFRRHNGMPSTI